MIWVLGGLLVISVAANAFLVGFIYGPIQGAERLFVKAEEESEESGVSEVSGNGAPQDPDDDADSDEHPPVLIGFRSERNGE
jgi:hypothetical protein